MNKLEAAKVIVNTSGCSSFVCSGADGSEINCPFECECQRRFTNGGVVEYMENYIKQHEEKKMKEEPQVEFDAEELFGDGIKNNCLQELKRIKEQLEEARNVIATQEEGMDILRRTIGSMAVKLHGGE